MTPVVLLTALLGAGPTAELMGHEVVRGSESQATLLLAPREVGRAAMQIRFDVGAFDDGGLPGLTRLTQFSMLHANRVLSSSKLTELLYRADATLEVRTGQSACTFELDAPATRFDSVAAPLLRALLATRFDHNEVDTALQRMVHQPPGYTAIEVAAIFSRATMPERGYDKDPGGDSEILASITVDQVSGHQQAHLRPANATIAIAGRFDARRIEQLVRSFRGGVPRPRPAHETGLAGLYTIRAPMQLHVLALPTPLGTAEQAAAAHLARSILTQRTFWHFRSHGLAYSVFGTGTRTPWLDFLLLSLPVVGQADGSTQRTLNALIDGMSDPELLDEAAFGRYRTALLRELEALDADPRRLANHLAMGGADEPWLSPEVVARIRGMSHAQFQSSTRTWLRSKAVAHVLLSPRPPPRRR